MAVNKNDPEAPHGRDESGAPLAPYGYKTDGTPRLSRRGAQAGQQGNGNATRRPSSATARAKVTSLTDVQRKGMLVDLADSLIVTPLASASQVKAIVDRVGPKQADALAADAFVLGQFMPHLADGLIVLSKTKPATLSWLDKAEENAPYLMLAQVGVQMAKALVANHVKPNPSFAAAGRSYANMRLAAMADEINRQADAVRAEQAEREQNAQVFADAA
jgi:hypothetical protein